jgi:hypothetical protein
MSSSIWRAAMTLVLAICFVCPVVEMFDQWDHTIQTGNDTEYALVVVALCVGTSYAFARAIFTIVERLVSRDPCATEKLILGPCGLRERMVLSAISASPPLTALRI